MFLSFILNLLPVFILLLAAGVILAIQRWQPSLGMSWLTALFGVLLAWGCLLVYRWVTIPPLTIQGWLTFGNNSFDLVFGYDSLAWHFAFCVATIYLAVMLTVPIRLTAAHDPREWVLDLCLGAAAMLPILAQTPLSLILAWTFVDIVEIIYHLSSASDERMNRQAIMAFAARLSGTLILYWAFLSAQFSGGGNVDFSSIEAGTGMLFLLAAGLRLGVFPVLVPFSREIPLRRELGSILRFAVPASSLVLLTRLDGLVMPSGWAVILSVLALLASLYGVLRFFFASSELTGRLYWMITLASMAVVSVVRGQGEAALVWSTVMILLGAFLSLHSYRVPGQWWLMMLGFLGLSALPFTPASAGWAGLLVLPFSLLDVFYILVQILLLLGFLKHAFRQEEADGSIEMWMKVVYPFGFLVLCLSQWFLGINNLTGSLVSGAWWASVLSVGMALALAFLLNRWAPNIYILDTDSSPLMGRIFGTGWILRFLESVYGAFQMLIMGISRILEGEGAILWALLLMILMLTILRMGVSI